jgi:hypothetical protein
VAGAPFEPFIETRVDPLDPFLFRNKSRSRSRSKVSWLSWQRLFRAQSHTFSAEQEQEKEQEKEEERVELEDPEEFVQEKFSREDEDPKVGLTRRPLQGYV